MSLVGLILSHFAQLSSAWKGGFAGALLASLLIAGTAVLLAARSKRKPVASVEVGKFNALLESYLKGETIEIGGERQAVGATTTTHASYVSSLRKTDANTAEFVVNLSVNPLSHGSQATEHWLRLDSAKRSQFTQALLPAERSKAGSARYGARDPSPSRPLINHGLLPLFLRLRSGQAYLSRNRAGEKIEERSHFSRTVLRPCRDRIAYNGTLTASSHNGTSRTTRRSANWGNAS